MLQPLFYGTTVPLALYFTFKKLILDPYERKRRKKEREKRMSACKERCGNQTSCLTAL